MPIVLFNYEDAVYHKWLNVYKQVAKVLSCLANAVRNKQLQIVDVASNKLTAILQCNCGSFQLNTSCDRLCVVPTRLAACDISVFPSLKETLKCNRVNNVETIEHSTTEQMFAIRDLSLTDVCSFDRNSAYVLKRLASHPCKKYCNKFAFHKFNIIE